MAEVNVRRELYITADTIGDVMKWLNYVDSYPMSTELTEPVTLAITVDEPAPTKNKERDEDARPRREARD